MLEILGKSALTLVSVADRGIPHRERIALQAAEDLELASFLLTTGVSATDGRDALPIRDSFIWLGSGRLKQGDWLLIYTGPGTQRVDAFGDSQVYSVYWGRKETVFYNPQIVPILMRLDGVWLLPPPHPSGPLPQNESELPTKS